MPKIFDAHTHLSESKNDALIRFARMNKLDYSLEELLKVMKRNGVERGLLLSPPLESSGCLSNDEIMKLCEKSGGILAPVVTVEPTAKEVTTAVRLARENRREVKAFKIRLGYVKAAANDPIFVKLYDFAESEKLPVLFHTGDTAFDDGDLAKAHPLTLDRLANKREDLTIVLCHFGNPWFDDVAELIYKHPNVYTDTSGLITPEPDYAEKYSEWLSRRMSEAVYYAHGADKILFGTDYPVTKHEDAIALIRKMDVSEEDKEKILYRNSERVFDL